MKDKSVRVRDAIATLLRNQNLKSLLEPEKLNELNEVQKMLIQSENSANRIEEGLQKTMNSEEASNELVDYYQSIEDIVFASRSLHTVANQINIEEKNIPEDFQDIVGRQNIFSKLINKIIKMGDRIKNRYHPYHSFWSNG